MEKDKPEKGLEELVFESVSRLLVVGEVSPVGTIREACELCGTLPWHNGGYPDSQKNRNEAGGAIPYTGTRVMPELGASEVMVWCPQYGHPTWHDETSPDGAEIREWISDTEKNDRHISHMMIVAPTRVTFLKNAPGGEKNKYTFMGVYKLDVLATQKERKCVWRRIDTRFLINQLTTDKIK